MNLFTRAMAVLLLVAAASGFGLPNASASQVDILLEKLVEKGIMTRLEVEEIRGEIETAEKKDFKAHLKSSNGWLDNLTSKGDIRLRYEAFNRESEDNRTATGDAGGTDRNRFRFRARWGLEKKFSDEWKAGFRVASGSGTTDATSTNQTFDNEFGLKDIFFDRAYAIYTPTQRVKDIIPATDVVEIGAGKVENPYDRDKWNTSIIWDSDVTPEGIYERWDFNLAEDKEAGSYWKFHTLMGQWFVDEDSDNSPGDQKMFSYGGGTTYQWAKDHKLSFKTTYYDWYEYSNYIKTSGTLSNNLGGNDREVDSFRILNFYGDVDFIADIPGLGKQGIKLFGDYATNLGLQDRNIDEDSDDRLINVPLRDDDGNAFSAGISIGKAKEEGEWSAMYEYLYIEPNAVVGNFAESDLGLGFANNKGHRLAYKYMIHKNIELNFTAWLVERVDKTLYTYGASDTRVAGDDDHILRTQLDLVYKF